MVDLILSDINMINEPEDTNSIAASSSGSFYQFCLRHDSTYQNYRCQILPSSIATFSPLGEAVWMEVLWGVFQEFTLRFYFYIQFHLSILYPRLEMTFYTRQSRKYSQTYVQWPPLLHHISDHCWQMVIVQRSHLELKLHSGPKINCHRQGRLLLFRCGR